MRRPVGVIITCIILCFIALSLLISAVGSLIVMTVMGQIPMPVQPGQPALDPVAMATIMHGTMIFLALFETALAGWAIATLVGLARMKNWARYSVMVIGGGLAALGILSAIGMIFAQAFVNAIAQQPGQDPTHIRIVMIIGGFFYLVIAGLGIWWLVYFAMRSTREAFELASNSRTALAPVAVAALPPSPYAASTYEVASYIPAPDPASTPAAERVEAAVPMPVAPPARPLAISIIAWLFIACAAFSLPVAFVPLPIFLLGILITGWTAHLIVLCFCVIYALIGIGLLRLEKIALYAAYAFQVFGLVNGGLLFVPSYRDRMLAYTNDLVQKMMMGLPMPTFDNHTMGLMMIPGVLLGTAFGLTLLAFLFYYRAEFNRPR